MIAVPLRTDVIVDAQGLAGLRAQWTGLLRESAADSPFLTWEWLYSWWIHLAGARRLCVVTVRAGHELIGVAPLAITRRGVPWLSRLEFLGTGFAGSDYLDLIVRPGYEAVFLEALTRTLASRALVLRLDHLPADSAATLLAGRLSTCGWTSARAAGGTCPFARLGGHSWESYLATLPASHQTRVRRYTNTLRKKFDVRFELATTDAGRREALAALMAFHEHRWRGQGGSTAFRTPSLRAFHEDATRRALDAGSLRLHLLRLDGAPAAVTYCFAHNQRIYLYQHGFNERFRQYSAGLVALALTIHSAIDERALEFDMLYGTEPYKGLWARDQRALERIDLYPAGMTGRIHQRTVEAKQTMRLLARRVLARDVCNPDIHSAGVAS